MGKNVKKGHKMLQHPTRHKIWGIPSNNIQVGSHHWSRTALSLAFVQTNLGAVVEIGEVLFQGKCGSKVTGTSEIWLKLVLTSWFLICHTTIFSVYNLGSLLLFGECWGMNFGCNSCLWTATESSESSEISACLKRARLMGVFSVYNDVFCT